MSIQHVELTGSRSGTDATDQSSMAELTWSVWGTDDHDDARDYLADNSVVPSIWDGLIFHSLSWEYHGNENWTFTASYVAPDRADKENDLDLGDYTWGFDTGGEVAHRQNSLGTTSYARQNETAPDFKGAINVVSEKGERKVEGVDVGIPGLKFWLRKRIPKASITLSYLATLAGLTYKYNNATFLGFAAGELLFVGATGQEGTNADPEITFNFIASPNVTGMTLGDITGIAKLGHEYLWMYYEDEDDAGAEKTVKRAVAAYVEKTYEPGDYSGLGIV